MKHELIQPSLKGGAHIVHRFVFADASAKTALNDTNKGTLSLAASDVGSICRVVSDGTFHLLTNHSPVTWKEVAPTASGGAPGGSANQIQYNDGAGGFAGSAAKASSAGALDLPEIATPSSPAGAVTLYASDGTVAGASPSLSTKDSEGIVSSLQPRVKVKGVSNLRIVSFASNQYITLADFTKSTGEMACFIMFRRGPGDLCLGEQAFGLPLKFEFKVSGVTQGDVGIGNNKANGYLRFNNASNTSIATTLTLAPPPAECGLFVYTQNESLDGDKRIRAGLVGSDTRSNTDLGNGFVDYSSNSQLLINAGTDEVVAVGIIDGIGTGSAAAGSTPWSANAPSPMSSAAQINQSFKQSLQIWTREGRLRNLAASETAGGLAINFDRLYLASDATTSAPSGGLTEVTAWAPHSSSVDTGASSWTIQGTKYQTDVDWVPQY